MTTCFEELISLPSSLGLCPPFHQPGGMLPFVPLPLPWGRTADGPKTTFFLTDLSRISKCSDPARSCLSQLSPSASAPAQPGSSWMLEIGIKHQRKSPGLGEEALMSNLSWIFVSLPNSFDSLTLQNYLRLYSCLRRRSQLGKPRASLL